MSSPPGPEEQDPQKGMSPTARVWVELGPLLGIGWVFVFSIAALAGLGWWLDARLGTGRALFIGGAIFGILIGFVNLFTVVARLGKGKGKGNSKP